MYGFIPIYGPLVRRLFPARVNFQPSKGPFILGSYLEFDYLWSVTSLFRLWAKFSPWLQSACLWPVNPLGGFHSVINYGLLTARYGRAIKHTISTLAHLWPILRTIFDPRRVRPMFGETIIQPVEGP